MRVRAVLPAVDDARAAGVAVEDGGAEAPTTVSVSGLKVEPASAPSNVMLKVSAPSSLTVGVSPVTAPNP